MSHLIAETDFGLDLLKKTKDDESVVLSPISISLALALVHVGAGGQTKEQIRNALLKGASDDELVAHYKQVGDAVLKSEQVKVLIANRMYIKNGFTVNPSYLDTISKEFAAKAENLDFSKGDDCANHVNNFVKEITHDKIQDLVNADTFNDAVALLVNAIYLDAKWQSVFHSDSTYEGDFYVKEGETKKVQYLSDREVHRLYAETDEAQILTLKYQDEAYSFTIILPKERFGLAKLRAGLTGAKLQEMLGLVKDTYINIKFPKFKIEKEIPLNEVLQSLGITQVFSDQADLSGIADEIKVSEVKHKALIEVDEWGTKAAAVTSIKCVTKCARPKPKFTVVADHSFLFLLSHNSHILFVGQFF